MMHIYHVLYMTCQSPAFLWCSTVVPKTLSLAALGFTPSGIPPIPQCKQPCTGRPGECPLKCKHCRRFRGTNGPVCGGSYG
uniref:Putative 5.3 kDa protein n=1 Tax=Ixodes ricinus TaxID=34613 RepID=A0A6B0U6Q9_IXORI